MTKGSRLTILVVEDEYMIAADLARSLEDLGMAVLGPAASVADALLLLNGEPGPDAAILDVILGGERVFALADTLQKRGVPFVFATGYDDWAIPSTYAHIRRFEKPVDIRALTEALQR